MRCSAPAGTRHAKPRRARLRFDPDVERPLRARGHGVGMDLQAAAERRLRGLIALGGEHAAPSPGRRRSAARARRRGRCARPRPCAPLRPRSLEARAAALRPQLPAERAVVEGGPAPREAVADAPARCGERHVGAVPPGRRPGRPSRAATAWARRTRSSGARRSRSGRARAGPHRGPPRRATSRATARPANEAPQTRTRARVPSRRVRCSPRAVARRVIRAGPPPRPPTAQPGPGAEDVVAVALDAVEHGGVDAAGHGHAVAHSAARGPAATRRCRRRASAPGRPLGHALARTGRWRRRHAGPPRAGPQVDAVQAVVDGHVADEVRQLEGDAQARHVLGLRAPSSAAAMMRPTVAALPSM